MTRLRQALACSLMVCLLAPALAAQEDEPANKKQIPEPPRQVDPQLFMRAKLAASQKVLEGLVVENFELILAGGEQMKEISQAAHWPTTVDEVYQHHGVAFRQQCDKLIKHAHDKNLDAAQYTYLHLTTTCLDCHHYVRRKFRVQRKPGGGPVQLIPSHWDGPVKKRPQPDSDG